MKKVLILLTIATLAGKAFAYERGTHEEMSDQAANRSVIASRLDDLKMSQFFTEKPVVGRTLLEWIRFGANSEDDYFSIGAFLRFRNHFYNPINGQGYSYGLISGTPSPLWALEDQADLSEQIYSLRHANDYYYLTLTLPTSDERDTQLALTFRTLGQVIHLVQDAAQPQHTRNDSHGSGSMYEKITDQMRASLPYGSYPNVEFATAREYWHTLTPRKNLVAGKGMAEYSNRNFVTADTNFRYSGASVINDPGFPSPVFDATTQLNIDVTTLNPSNPALRGIVTFYGNTVTDAYDGSSSVNPFATTLSVFDADLRRHVSTTAMGGLFTLNKFNVYYAQQFLVPRAVGYSAGLLDYFFRGEIDMEPDTLKSGTYRIKNLSTEKMNGKFTLYYDATDGLRYAVPGGAWTIHIPKNGQSSSLTFSPPSNQKTQGRYMLVFRGTLGKEKETDVVIGKLIVGEVKTNSVSVVTTTLTDYRTSEFDGTSITDTYEISHRVDVFLSNEEGVNLVTTGTALMHYSSYTYDLGEPKGTFGYTFQYSGMPVSLALNGDQGYYASMLPDFWPYWHSSLFPGRGVNFPTYLFDSNWPPTLSGPIYSNYVLPTIKSIITSCNSGYSINLSFKHSGHCPGNAELCVGDTTSLTSNIAGMFDIGLNPDCSPREY